MIATVKRLARDLLPRPAVAALRARGEGLRFLASTDAPRRWRLLGRFQDVTDHVECTQAESETLMAVRGILDLPPAVPGIVVECGCYRGGATAKLSIAARETGRGLAVFDSFEGLPLEGGRADPVYRNWQEGSAIHFIAGTYASRLDETRANVDRWGEGAGVGYVPGFFCDSMPRWTPQPIAAIVLDVDLASSTRDCIRHLWPHLSPGGLLYSQDGHLDEIVTLLRDPAFWAGVDEPRPPRFDGLGRQKMVVARKGEATSP
jgi:O-methyltransferase